MEEIHLLAQISLTLTLFCEFAVQLSRLRGNSSIRGEHSLAKNRFIVIHTYAPTPTDTSSHSPALPPARWQGRGNDVVVVPVPTEAGFRPRHNVLERYGNPLSPFRRARFF
jgi:hypothetical protein